ncbi:MAG: hypothetical protein LLG97_16155 [Deltaproteobacteria bacterium]|nr:hypothetical protein [Deltaproteobacteria bacterium]
MSKLEAGMKLAKPVSAKSGMVMLGEGTELTAKWIERIQDMGVTNVFVEGLPVQAIPREEALADLNARFSRVEGKPFMNTIKSVVKEHVEGLYE